MTILEESFTNMSQYAILYPVSDSTDTNTVYTPVPTTTSTVNFYNYTINGKDIDDFNTSISTDGIKNSQQLSFSLPKQINQSRSNQKQVSQVQSSIDNGVSLIKTHGTKNLNDECKNGIGESIRSSIGPFDSNDSEIDSNNSSTTHF